MNPRHLFLVEESTLPPVGRIDQIRRARKSFRSDRIGLCVVLPFPLHPRLVGSGQTGAASVPTDHVLGAEENVAFPAPWNGNGPEAA